jgi:hypothetical protein
MQGSQLTYHLLNRFEVTAPGVDLRQIEIEGYEPAEILERLEMLRLTGLIDILAACDKGRRPYSGMIVGLTTAGAELLDTMRPKQQQKVEIK